MIEKVINGGNYRPTLTDKIVLDSTPTVNSLNGVTSDGVARAIAGASGEVPVVTEGDNGKILTAIYDAGGPAVEWAEAPSGIPDMTGKNGKILGAVDNGGTMEAQWIDKPNPSAGDGIDVSAAGVISAKVGAGLTIADYSQSSHVSETVTVAGRNTIFQNYTFEYLAPCTADIINAINTSDVSFTTANNFSYSAGGVNANITGCYAAILSKTGNYAPSVANRLVLGSVAYVDTTQDPEASGTQSVKVTSGTVATFSMSDYDSVGSTITLADVQADPAGYVLALVAYDAGNTSWGICNFGLNGTATATTGTIAYDSGYSVEDAINVTNPVPTYAAGDAGKVLQVNAGATGVEWAAVPQELPASLGAAGQVLTVNSGATGVEWATLSGGSSNVEIITLSSSTASAIDTFAAAVHTAYAAGKVVVAKLVNAESIYTMYLPMTKAYEGETTQYFFGGQAMYFDDRDSDFHPAEYYMYVFDYGDPHFYAKFNTAKPTELAWTPFQ